MRGTTGRCASFRPGPLVAVEHSSVREALTGDVPRFGRFLGASAENRYCCDAGPEVPDPPERRAVHAPRAESNRT